jgi:acetyltransferase-like isoleucine patch superfamily enzyme
MKLGSQNRPELLGASLSSSSSEHLDQSSRAGGAPSRPKLRRRPFSSKDRADHAPMIRSALERIIKRVRDDDGYHLDPDLRARDALAEVIWRGRCLARAQWKLAGVAGGYARFVEPGCHIRHRRYLSIGRGSVVEHGARFSCLSREGIHIGSRVTIGKYALIECTSVLWHLGCGLRVGDDSSIGDYSFVGCAGGVTIGRNVLMGQRVSFHSQNHNFDDATRPIRNQGVTDHRITIGDDCWLGAGTIVLAGVDLGDGCVVAAGSVVNRSFGPNSVLAGVPARLVKVRGEIENGGEGETTLI